MAGWQRPEWLSMVGLGTNGGQPLLDGSPMQRGVHLRWQSALDLGFPRGGFDVYRRAFLPRPKYCARFLQPVGGGDIVTQWDNDEYDGNIAITPGGAATTQGCGVPQPYVALHFQDTQRVRIDLSEPMLHVEITFDEATPLPVVGTAYWHAPSGDVRVDRDVARPATPQTHVLRLWADRIDHVILRGKDMIICRICVIPVEASIRRGGWGQQALNGPTPIHLPVDHPEWTAPYPDPVAEAASRLSPTLSTPTHNAYLDSYNEDLAEILYDLVGTRPQLAYQLVADDDEATDPDRAGTLTWSGLQLLHLLALDPNYARVIGLYFVDTDVQPGVYYDYLVMGHWEDQLYPGQLINFRILNVGDRYTAGLEHEGLALVTPRPIEIVETTFEGEQKVAAAVDPAATLFPASLWLHLPEPVPLATLRITTEDAATLRTWDGPREVGSEESLAEGEHTLQLQRAAPFASIEIESNGTVTLFGVNLHSNADTIGDIHYVTFRHRVEPPPPLTAPELETPVALPAQAEIDSDGILSDAQNAAGLRWEQFDAGGGYLLPHAPIRYHVARGEPSAGGAPPVRTVLNPENPIAAVGDDGVRPPDYTGPGLHFVDRPLPDGWYGYSVRGIDLFGRLGPWSEVAYVEARESVPPSPPRFLDAVYLDPADPNLSPEDTDWADTTGGGGKLAWEWGGWQRLQAPDVEAGGEFRVYMLPGPLNVLRGTITAVTSSVATSTLTTDQVWPGSEDDLAGESVRVGDTFFPIVGNSAGNNFTLTAENLTLPDESPLPDPFSITFSRDRAYWTDPCDPTAWEARAAVVPPGSLPIFNGTVTGVDGGTDPARLEIDVAVAELEPDLTPGVLISDGLVYTVAAHERDSASGTLLLDVLPRAEDGDPDPVTGEPPTRLPAIGETCAYYPGRIYTLYLENFRLQVPSGEAFAVGHLTISAADGKPHAIDDPRWAQPGRGGLGNRPGNEGPPAPARMVLLPQRQPPPPPTVARVQPGDPPIYARPADFYGIARYTLTWDAVPGATGYALYRCTGATLATWSGTDTATLSDPDLQTLASLPENEGAFRCINETPVTGTSYTDAFDGRGRGVYLYRIAAIDAASNLGALSDALPPVHIYDVTPPETPRLISVLGGEQLAALAWQANREPDLAAYHLWQAEAAEALADVRRREPIAVIVPTPGAIVERYLDTGLTGGVTYYYCLAAIDDNGNRSEPTPVRAARAVDTLPPEQPQWERAEWIRLDPRGNEYGYDDPEAVAAGYRAHIALQWLAAESGTTATVERNMGGRTWMPITQALSPVDPSDLDREEARRFRYYDAGAGIDGPNRYRIRLQDQAGNINLTAAEEIEVSPPS